MAAYEAPAIVDLGSLAELTLDVITKNPGTGDVIVVGPGPPTPVPGGGVISVSP
jgi:hypothetical protein